MGRTSLNDLFDSWARWVHRGSILTSGTSMLAKIIENKGHMSFGGGASQPVLDCIEAEIEQALLQLSDSNREAVELFRLEYGAVRMRDFDPHQSQIKKAARLGISVRTYRRRLAVCTNYIVAKLTDKREKYL
ncbi:hypothetical protein [Pseudoalteromonas sp. Of7M-16]|uniref:hypothetical protein n=1 Tax=Pseudoalteromonas sp. Of7M-16 TaxID=2917756 RepID=UPI001EF70EB9|nr:hypothetical protein [Pseudoalteromonas sp. Of7M-16]MCG7551603.1 hypothetical protein [Pseudoalteromonas sp. Of7M-16]